MYDSLMSTYTPEQHRQAPSWVVYEVKMLLDSSRVEKRGADEMGTANPVDLEYWRAVRTCGLESFLVHYRNLKEFLNNLKFPTDVKAVDYVPAWTGNSKVTPTYSNEDERINQLLAHITYKRADYDIGNWDVAKMEQNLCDALSRFIEKVGKTEYATLFERVPPLLTARHPRLVVSTSSTDGNSTATVTTAPSSWWDSIKR